MNIVILGAGYIGSDVAALWTKKGHHVTATTHLPDQLESLSKVAQKCIILKENDENELASLILNNDLVLITYCIDIPDQYDETLQLAHAIRRISLDHVPPHRLIYAGNSTVYGDHHGLWVDENSKLKIKSDLGKLLIEAERIFLSLSERDWHISILRLAEIYGPGRELSQHLRTLQGQTLPGSGKNFSNMVHRADVTAAIDFVFRRRLDGIYNLADDDHPTRQELYDLIAKQLNLQTINWDPKLVTWHGGNKRVSNRKIKSKGYNFHYPQRILD